MNTRRLTFDAPAAVQQRTNIAFDGTHADELVADQVRVVRGRNVVLGQGACHIVPDFTVVVCEWRVFGGEEEGCESC